MVGVPKTGFVLIALVMLGAGSFLNIFDQLRGKKVRPVTAGKRESTARELFSPLKQYTAPYDQIKYRSVIDQSYLQAPTSGDRLVEQGEFAGVYNQYFYVPDEGDRWMTFEVSGKDGRSELRQVDIWSTNDTAYAHGMRGHLVVEQTEVDQITFMQIHDRVVTINRPLLRMVWMASFQGVEDAYWAFIKSDACPECRNYDKYMLAPRTAMKVEFEVLVKQSKLTITVNGAVAPQINNYDVNYWNHLKSYWKAGVYNNWNNGTGKVKFWTLDFYTIPL
eukprot:TRINITY_DN1564_c2_g1_i1.p1 TRINITY_DN1564_c2_g1~~TRINITY_DN1564_c2_g1_i1.p1  ORF type:complete len:277 (+),score=41.34 TRINITY_DN1564_c2_g1_i1:60-890(+)